MTDALQAVAALASRTLLNTGSPRCVVPPFLGVTPPTIWVPYAMAWGEEVGIGVVLVMGVMGQGEECLGGVGGGVVVAVGMDREGGLRWYEQVFT